MKRKLFLATGLSAALSACSQIGTKLNDNPGFHGVLEKAENVNERLIGTRGRARLYSARDISADFPVNSLDTPGDARYMRLMGDRFASYRLTIDGSVDRPQQFTLPQLQHLMNGFADHPSRLRRRLERGRAVARRATGGCSFARAAARRCAIRRLSHV